MYSILGGMKGPKLAGVSLSDEDEHEAAFCNGLLVRVGSSVPVLTGQMGESNME